MLQRDDYSAGFEGNHTFIVHAGRDGSHVPGTPSASLSFEVAGVPGLFLTAPQSSFPGHDSFGPQYTACTDKADDCADRITGAQQTCTGVFAGNFGASIFADVHGSSVSACSTHWRLCCCRCDAAGVPQQL